MKPSVRGEGFRTSGIHAFCHHAPFAAVQHSRDYHGSGLGLALLPNTSTRACLPRGVSATAVPTTCCRTAGTGHRACRSCNHTQYARYDISPSLKYHDPGGTEHKPASGRDKPARGTYPSGL